MLQLNLNPQVANQTILLPDSSIGQLSGTRVPQASFSMIPTIQWTFIVQDHEHEGFVYTGNLQEGQVISSLNGNDKYKIHFAG